MKTYKIDVTLTVTGENEAEALASARLAIFDSLEAIPKRYGSFGESFTILTTAEYSEPHQI